MATNDNDAKMFKKVVLIGVGLIGSSLARAMKKHGLAGKIIGCARTQKTLDRCLELGFVDGVDTDMARAVKGADLVVISTPVGTFDAIGRVIGPHLDKGCILTDVGSTKMSVVQQLSPHVREGVHFVPAHPIAGTEHSGPDAGFAELFIGRWCVVTPPEGASQEGIDKVVALWEAVGSNVEIMDPAHHDIVLAVTSHVPHLIAYNIVNTAQDLEEVTSSEIIKYSAAGFRDFTRIAASDPVMWRDVFLNNKEAVLEVLGRFSEDLALLQRAVRWGNGPLLEDIFTRGRAVRRGILDAHQDTDNWRKPEDV